MQNKAPKPSPKPSAFLSIVLIIIGLLAGGIIAGTSLAKRARIESATATCSPDSQTFIFTGEPQSFTVPAGCSTLILEAWGARGAPTGGLGGYERRTLSVASRGRLSVASGTVLYVYVGGQGGYEGYRTNTIQNGGSSGVLLNGDIIIDAGGGIDGVGGGGGICDIDKNNEFCGDGKVKIAWQ